MPEDNTLRGGDESNLDQTPDRIQLHHQAYDFSGHAVFLADVFDGTPTTKFTVESRLLVNSEYFQTALKQEWAAGQNRTVSITDMRADTFNMYLNWQRDHYIYAVSNKMTSCSDDSTSSWTRLAECYIFRERLMDSDSKDAVIDACVQFLEFLGAWPPANDPEELPDPTVIRLLYDNFVPCAKVREFLVDVFASTDDKYELLTKGHPTQFVIGVHRKVLDSTDVEVSADSCEYYEHGSRLCYRLRFKGHCDSSLL